MKIIIFIFMLGVILSGCTNKAEESNSAVNTSEMEQSKSTSAKEVSNVKVGLNQNVTEGIAIYGTSEKETGYFSSIIVEIDSETKTFPWRNITNPSFYPELLVSNIDEDKEDEIILILATEKGTSVRQSEIYVLNRDFTEIEVTDPLDKLADVIKWGLKKKDNTREYTISIQGKGRTFKFNEDESRSWSDEPFTGNIVRYGLHDGYIIAEIPVQVSAGHYIGNVIVRYGLVEGKIRPTNYEYQEETIL
ncbi:hypothetical protein QPK24_12240 [Paenibacillus polygoni]|uniref:Uncharacterized protein n=1 Tax=Paenibacillus polygoni TaxID=3050112 RepID=A0ABY8WX15_9BACL|nr:hypothetical protein [Paenibacillus polygoni]WIV17224.1 hypothetical protein QPK24_12240 [Paenibacillus polygoni]